jgi:hypothetical protein
MRGDLVCFTGYDIEANPLSHKMGIVMNSGIGRSPYTLYEVMWIDTGDIISVAGKHLTLAYTRE